MIDENERHLPWTKEFAMWLELITHNEPEIIPPQFYQKLSDFSRIWNKIAKTINFDYSDDTVIETLRSHFPVTNSESFLSFFDNADEAINFFKDFRPIESRTIFLLFRRDSVSFSPEVQNLICFFSELIKKSPVAFARNPCYQEAINVCLRSAIKEKGITLEVLKQLHEIIRTLCMYQIKYIDYVKNSSKNRKISDSKQEQVKQRQMYFDEFTEYHKSKQDSDSKISCHKAALSFFDEKAKKLKDENFSALWINGESFYKSFCNRNQSKDKNNDRILNQQAEASEFQLPQRFLDPLSDWYQDR